MSLQGPMNNPFQFPGVSSGKERQGGSNPFQHAAGPKQQGPEGDALSSFQSQINQGQIQPNLDMPRPPQGMGNRFLAYG